MVAKPNNFGFTLVEVIIAISISVILFLIISLVYYVSQNAYKKTDTRAEITQNGRVMLDRIIRELRQAQRLITVLPPDNSNPAAWPSEIEFENGLPTKLNGKKMKLFEIVKELGKIGAKHAIGITHLIEDRIVGLKVRGIYEEPAAEILIQAKKKTGR